MVEPFSNLHSVIVAPDTMKTDFLRQVHDDAGHQGIERTLTRLKYLAYWVRMASNVSDFVTSCEICQKSNYPYQLRPHYSIPPCNLCMLMPWRFQLF